jgi:hypothetical protein
MSARKRFRRVVLELALKPFRVLKDDSVREVCAELFRQWAPLIRPADESAVLLWTSDGTEILTYRGRPDDEFEWARYIGFANTRFPNAYERPGCRDYRKAVLYTDAPPAMTYGWLRRIVQALKHVGREATGKPVRVGATFDPGPEFADSPWRYELHPEVFVQSPKGLRSLFLCAYATLHGDSQEYAGYPDGIPEGTPFGRFLGRQAQRFLTDLGFDYIWFSNGFGFSHFGSSRLGEAFDGKEFDQAAARAFAEKTLGFWRDFRSECPDYPIETRGSNLTTGVDLSRDGVPMEGIYRGGFNVAPPPNSPWGALDGDFALELVGHMSRIAELPGEEFPFRFYVHDAWYPIRPWYDAYGRRPLDIYCPLALGRINGKGEVEHPASVEFLAVNTCEGDLPERSAIEVVPHVLTGADHLPDAPGIVTWVYPWTEYHEMTFGEPCRMDEVFLGDWFVQDAVNNGFPVNTVVSSESFASSYALKPGAYAATVLFLPVPSRRSPVVNALCDFVSRGGKAILYGPVTHAHTRVREMLNLALAAPVSGQLAIDCAVGVAPLEEAGYPERIHHRPISSAGGMEEVLADPDDAATSVCATCSGNGEERVAALLRSLPEWKGGAVAWVRATNSFEVGDPPRRDDPEQWFIGGCLPRFLLARLGYTMSVVKYSPAVRTPIWFVSRSDNAFYFTGYTPDTTVVSRFRFPYGAPALVGWQTRLREGFSTYAFGTCYHEECRLFVDQAEEATVSCTDLPSRFLWIRRRLKVTGLKDATIRFFRDSTCPDARLLIARIREAHPHGDEEECAYELEGDGAMAVARHVSGGIMISW